MRSRVAVSLVGILGAGAVGAVVALACGGGGGAGPDADAGGGGDDVAIPPTPTPDGDGSASVIQHHHHATRDGLYLEPTFTKAAVRTTHLDGAWPIDGPVYAAPLFLDGALGGKDALLVASEKNVVHALDARSTATLWTSRGLPQPVPLAMLRKDPGCGNIDPLGITGTPYVDLDRRAIYFDAMTTPDDGTTKRHQVFALSIDDGRVLDGWPVDLESALGGGATPFVSKAQGQRGAALVHDGVLYVPFGGHAGDCGDYHGWLVGIDLATRVVKAWSTPARGGAAWAVAGPSSDGASIFVTTGNTQGAGHDPASWVGGEAVLRFGKGPVFSGSADDFFAPSNWPSLDDADLDLGGSAAVLADLPGAAPSALVVALGKDGNVYLLDRARLGGVGQAIATLKVGTSVLNGAATVYATPRGTFVTFRVEGGTGVGCANGRTGNVVALRLGAASPPTISVAWCAHRSDLAAPIASVSSTAGDDAIVWAAAKTGELVAYDGETGDVLVGGLDGGSAGTTVDHFQTPIVAKGRIYVAGMGKALAFRP